MKRIAYMLALVALAAAWSGCNAQSRQPRLTEAVISPERLQPGDTAIITVKVERDRFDIVDKVRAVVREDRRMKFDLKDDGTTPDVEAGDDVWSLLVDVPFMAPPGEFTLELTGYDAEGAVISVLGPEGGEMPLSTTCLFVVEHAVGEPEKPEKEEQPPESN